MNPYIFSKDNPHSWRAKLLVFFMAIISASIAYFAQAYFVSRPAIIEEQNQQAENNDQDSKNKEQETTNTDKELTIENQKTEIDSKNDSASLMDQMNEEIKENKEILLPPPIERNKNPETKLEEAMIYAQPQILAGKYIDISLGYQNMVIFENGKALNAFLISSGKKGFDTPIGTFKIENKYPRAWSKKYGLWMPYWMAFKPAGEMGIHELPEWPGGYKEGANHLGTAVSHGCVRLGVDSAKQVYDWAEIGTPVIIHK